MKRLLLLLALCCCLLPALGCVRAFPGPMRPWPVRVLCPRCGGAGEDPRPSVPRRPCSTCCGRGWVWR